MTNMSKIGMYANDESVCGSLLLGKKYNLCYHLKWLDYDDGINIFLKINSKLYIVKIEDFSFHNISI